MFSVFGVVCQIHSRHFLICRIDEYYEYWWILYVQISSHNYSSIYARTPGNVDKYSVLAYSILFSQNSWYYMKFGRVNSNGFYMICCNVASTLPFKVKLGVPMYNWSGCTVRALVSCSCFFLLSLLSQSHLFFDTLWTKSFTTRTPITHRVIRCQIVWNN